MSLIISIHAPAWGATGRGFPRRSARRNFNPRTRVGCDAQQLLQFLHRANFNPRTRVGCDAGDIFDAVLLVYFNPRTRVGCDAIFSSLSVSPNISIHAPAWGATAKDLKKLSILPEISIHAPAWGATYGRKLSESSQRFQSTHPRGVRPIFAHRERMSGVYFNPRTRVGCDNPPRKIYLYVLPISIHAPAWGATGIEIP